MKSWKVSIILIFISVFVVATNMVSGDSRETENTVHRLAQEHPANWVDEDMHGEYVEKHGTSECRDCHGRNLEGDDGVPSCVGCHRKHDD